MYTIKKYNLNSAINIFYSLFTKPERFEFFDPSFTFANLNNINNYECNGEVINAGMRKIDLWDKMTIILSIQGLMPLSNNVSAIRIDEDILKIYRSCFPRGLPVREEDILYFALALLDRRG